MDEEFIAQPRRWNIASIRNFMIFIGPISSIFDYATFFLMLYFFKCRLAPGVAEPDQTYQAMLFHTGWFVESLLTQTLIVHIIRTRRIPFLQSRPSGPMLASTLLIMGIGAWLPFSPLAHWLGFVPLPPVYFLWIAGFLLAYSILTHLVKMWFIRKFGTD